jgi:transcriptional regulator with XRE-family HTH domain
VPICRKQRNQLNFNLFHIRVPIVVDPVAEFTMSRRAEQLDLVSRLRQAGCTFVEIADALRRQFGVNVRVAFRLAHGWSQQDVADQWNYHWPDKRKMAKNISYWELWPGSTGHAPSIDVIERLAQLYQCSVADLLADRGNYRDLDTMKSTVSSQSASAALQVSRHEAPQGWYVKSLVTLLRLDTDTPAALEERTIVATRDGLEEIATSMSIPRHPEDSSPVHELEVELLSGGRLELREQPNESQFRHVIALASPLLAGAEHLYRLRIRIPPPQMMIDHSVQIPLQRSDFFSLTVRFSLDHLPSRIWLMDGVPPAVLRDKEPKGRIITADRLGEITVAFDELVQGQVYGLKWKP